jgi:hypothetical protein
MTPTFNVVAEETRKAILLIALVRPLPFVAPPML